MDEFFFEVTRYSISGFSTFARAREFSRISPLPANILSRNYFDAKRRTCLLFAELSRSEFMRTRIGMIASTKSPSDLNPISQAEDFFSSPDWVDEVIFSLSASKPPETAFPEEFGGQEILSALENNARVAPNKNSGTAAFSDRDGRVRKSVHEGEQFFLGKNSYVNAFEDKITRYTFDDSHRITKRERLELGKTSADLKTVRLENFSYPQNGDLPSKSIVEDFEKKSRIETKFNSSGVPVSVDSYFYDADKKLQPEKKTRWTFDSKGRMTSVESETWTYQTAEKSNSRKVQKTKTKNEFIYTEFSAPNKRYYEDGILRVERIFSSETDYDESVYFDEGLKIVIHYEDGEKKNETVYAGSVVVRRRDFAQ